MLEPAVRFVSLFCMGLAAGITVCVLLTEQAWAGTARFYTELKQLWIRVLTVPAPALGALATATMLVDTYLLFERGARAALWLVAAAVVLNVAALALTKLGHFPINHQILEWDPANPPADWGRIRVRWSALHAGRTALAVGSFSLLLLASVLPA